MNKLIPDGNLTGMPNIPNNLLRVAIYPRKSNKSEGRSRSVEEQVESCQMTCKYYGLDIDNIELYEEDEGQKGEWYWQDKDGRNPKPWRPELTRLVSDIEAGKIDVVVVWRSDRLYRDAGVCDALMKVFRANGTRFICGLRDMDIDSATGLYQASVEAANNRKYRDTVSEDICRDHDFKAQMGMFSRNPSCLGYRSKGKGTQEVDIIWEEIELINRIYRLFISGEGDRGPMGINAIANLLMDEGVRIARGAKGHKPKNPEKVYTSQIRTILTNCMYIGRWRHKGQEFKCNKLLIPARDGSGKRETAVPVSLFEAAEEKFKLTDRPGKRSAFSEHLLSGLVICSYCGRPLHVHYKPRNPKNGNTREPSRAFVCANRKPPSYCKPYRMRMIQEDVLDDWVIRELAPLLVAEIESVRCAAGRDADTQSLAELDRKVNDLQKKETQALRDMLGIFDREQITRVASDFRSEREQLQRKADEIQSRLKTNCDLPDLSPDALADMPKSAIKDALRRAVQWIAIGREGITALTNFGTYIGATLSDIEKGTYFTSETRTTINIPTPIAALRCLSWLPSPDDFIKGRRNSIGRRGEKLTDEEILPGFSQLNGEPLPEVELNIEMVEIKN